LSFNKHSISLQRQDIVPASNLVVKVPQSPVISPGHWGFVLKMSSPTRAGGFKWKYSPLPEYCHDNPFRLTATTVDTVIPSSSTSVDRPPSLLPFPIDYQGQPLLSTESTSSHHGQVTINEDSEEATFAVLTTGSSAVKSNGILHPPVSPRLAHCNQVVARGYYSAMRRSQHIHWLRFRELY